VTSEVEVCEVDGRELDANEEERHVAVISHWNRDALIVLKIDGHSYTVEGAELKLAIQNAENRGNEDG